MTQSQQILTTWFQRVWKEEEAAAIDEFYLGGEVVGLGAQILLTPDEFKEFHTAMLALLSDVEIHIDKCLCDGPWISALCSINARSRASGQPIRLGGTVWGRIEAGLIKEAYNHFDFLSLWEQLGLVPEGAFAQGLQGKTII